MPQRSPRAADKPLFTQTRNTWIDQQRQRGVDGRHAVDTYLVETYAQPLKVYLLKTSWASMLRARQLDPNDVVHDFLAGCLLRDEFLDRWHESGKRLRGWLINGLHFHLRSLLHQRHDEAIDSQVANPSDPAGGADALAEREIIRALLRSSLAMAQQSCGVEHAQHFDMFLRHHLAGESMASLGEAFGVSAERASRMVGTARAHFRRAFEETLRRENVDEAEFRAEIAAMMEMMSS